MESRWYFNERRLKLFPCSQRNYHKSRTIHTVYNESSPCYVVGIMQFTKEYWNDGAVEVDFIIGRPPEDTPISASGAFTFIEPSQLVLTKNQRGWDLPGGHVEEGETVLEALHREIEEEIEGRIVAEPIMLGYRLARELRPHAKSHKYPKVCALPLYLTFVTIDTEAVFKPRLEVEDRMTLHIDHLPGHFHNWTAQRDEVLSYARQHYPHFFTK